LSSVSKVCLGSTSLVSTVAYGVAYLPRRSRRHWRLCR